jgi:hypothetical protein
MGLLLALALMIGGLMVAGPIGAIIGLLLGIAAALLGRKRR